MKFSGEFIQIHADSHEKEQMYYRSKRWNSPGCIEPELFHGHHYINPAPLDFLGRPDVNVKEEFKDKQVEFEIAAYKLLLRR